MPTHWRHGCHRMPSPQAHSFRGPRRAWTLAVRGILLSVLWAVLVEAHPEGLWVGLVAVPLALAASLALSPPGPTGVRWWALLRFLPGFARRALTGSVDVALRALRPGPPVSPGYLDVPVRLPGLPSRVFLSSVGSLIPGTLGVDLDEGHLTLHLLDARAPAREAALEELRALERSVAAIFGVAPVGGPRP